MFLISSLVGVWIMQYLFRRTGHPLGFWQLYKVISISQLAKYVPGTLWQFVLRFRYLQGAVSDHSFFVVTVLENVVTFLAGFAVAAAIGFQDLPGAARWLAFGVAAGSLMVVLMPSIFYFFFIFGYGLAKRGETPPYVRLTRAVLFNSFLASVVNWVIKGIGCYLAVVSLVTLPHDLLWRMVAVYATSVVAGYVLLVFPGGLGIREGVMIIFLQKFVGFEVATFIAVVARAWAIFSEVLSAGLSYIIRSQVKD